MTASIKTLSSYALLGMTMAINAVNAQDVPVRIMPLGASITWGLRSTHGNGYRDFLYGSLMDAGYQVEFAGSQKSGDMIDPRNEGFPGYHIAGVHDKAVEDVPAFLPNIYTINVGTNDCATDDDVDHAHIRMEDMLSYLWSVTPDATIILSTLLVNLNPDTENRVTYSFNPQMRDLVEQLDAQGKHIILAEMHGDDGPQEDEMADDTHPNDAGYKKMADIWFREIQQASSNGWIKSAAPIS